MPKANPTKASSAQPKPAQPTEANPAQARPAHASPCQPRPAQGPAQGQVQLALPRTFAALWMSSPVRHLR
eukprot:1165815-Alexandrium_andersonii.AAC.1